nr:type II toxin-antitoxin system RelE/ParE family toxin [Methylobacterium sp. Leaf399]
MPADLRARLVRIAMLIEAVGFEGLPHDTVKHLDGKLWEIRVKAKSGISRSIYVTVAGRRVVIVRVFVKKTQKTPQRELDTARKRASEVP